MNEKRPLLRLEEIDYRIGQTDILRQVSFSLMPGEFKLITGPSGCGKSTLLKIIASLISPSDGHIWFDGQDINSLAPESYRQQVSYCAQTPALFGATVYDNLAFPWQIRGQTPGREKLVADLARFSLPDSLLEKGINELSGGEKQRVSLIRNLQFLPKVLLLDEITSALDESNKRSVNDLIHQYVQERQMAVLWVTHDREEISHADEVITLPAHAGKLREESQHESA
ncbi:iron efflux ABC transporter ATP-binding subunit FetA [Entomohabitans teleogrylli]|uniref:iron efflux ABC transporter ATP-binding subunit FetA n=1 Tax=Entomohabitans teleogrylli TaxID=1384589 RepID=UPI00073D8C30|nr:iron ABC transporter ATP-binding protein FetA [Entomohabitans teleogrylli]